ncbi:hypothetical protein B1L02_06415 [Pseudoalteromonas piscicida]|nr:hypothetical protein B1L02_06415 [Pseudoalteromonas piscicida]
MLTAGVLLALKPQACKLCLSQTTKIRSGGMRFGADIIYTLVAQCLDGDINTVSELGKELEYRIAFANKQAAPLKVVS